MSNICLIGCAAIALAIPYVSEASSNATAALQIVYLLTGLAYGREFA